MKAVAYIFPSSLRRSKKASLKIPFPVLFPLSLFLAHGVGFACSCASPGSILERRARVEKTVYGTVVQKDSVLPLSMETSFNLRVVADYSRGGAANMDTMRFYTATSSAACGVDYNLGDTVIVFGSIRSVSGQDTLYTTISCYGNVVNPTAAELDELAQALAIKTDRKILLRIKGTHPMGIVRGYAVDGRRADSKRRLVLPQWGKE